MLSPKPIAECGGFALGGTAGVAEAQDLAGMALYLAGPARRISGQASSINDAISVA